MKERRFVKGAEVRAAAETGHIDGHAAVFNTDYTLMDFPDFKVVERIKPGAFDRAIKEKQDVRALFNHDPSFLLGRTTAGTLSLKEDGAGLYFDNTPPDTQTGRDVRTLIERGDVTGCSFAFEVTKQTRSEKMADKQLIVTREVEDVNLYDVGPVTYPAYESTDVSARQIDFRGLFPTGYPEPMRRHLSDLGLPADLQRPVDTEPAEVKTKITELQGKIIELTVELAEARAVVALNDAAAEKAKRELEEERAARKSEQSVFNEEKAGVAAWIQRTVASLNEITTTSRLGISEVHKRSQATTGLHDELKACQERLARMENQLEIDQNWQLFTDDLEKVLQQSDEAAKELGRRTRLW